MKKLLVIGLVSSFFSAGAFAACSGDGTAVTDIASTTAGAVQCACNGGVAAKVKINGGAGASVTTPVFVSTGFNMQCSANTIVSYNEVSPTAFAVASGSRKGNRTFKGSTAGGGVAEMPTPPCPATGCTGALVDAALTVAATEATSS